jgi:hypothetical protein
VNQTGGVDGKQLLFAFDDVHLAVFTGGMRVLLALVFVGLMASGCAWFGRKPSSTQAVPKPGAPVVTADLRISGRVKTVNVKGRFVFLSFPVVSMPAVGECLSIYRDGLKVGVVRVTGPQRDEYIVADIVAGGAHEGDEVRSD